MKSILAACIIGAELASGACPDCQFDLTVLEEFTSTWETVVGTPQSHGPDMITAAPTSLPQSHGSLAVDARNLQLKLDSNTPLPEGFHVGPLDLGGHTVHEEIHMNGATNQASYHLSTPILSLCVLLDAPAGIPPAAQMEGPQIQQALAQAEQIVPQLVQQNGQEAQLDGVDVVALVQAQHHPYMVAAFDKSNSHPALVAVELDPREAEFWEHVISPPPSMQEMHMLALKFTGYTNSVGDAFSVRACSIESQSATATMLSSNPDLKDFAKSRVRTQTASMRRLLQNPDVNTRYNFLDLAIAEKLFPDVKDCGSALPEKVESSGFTSVGTCSFIAGLAAAALVLAAYSKFNKKVIAEQDSAYSVM